MKLFNLLLLCSATVGVLGSEAAAGWEAVFYYYAYRMDYESNDAKGRTIAIGCTPADGRPAHSKGGCKFPDFIVHIEKKSKKTPLGKFDPNKTPVGVDQETPDPTVASDITSWEGRDNPAKKYQPNNDKVKAFFTYDGSYDTSKIFPEGTAKTLKNHGDVLRQLGKVIQESRAKAGDAKIASYLENSRTCMTNIVYGRLKENASHLIDDLKPKIGIKDIPKMKITEPNSGREYDVLDSNKLIDNVMNDPSLDAAMKERKIAQIRDFEANYTKESDDPNAKPTKGVTHHRDIRAASDVLSLVKSVDASCS